MTGKGSSVFSLLYVQRQLHQSLYSLLKAYSSVFLWFWSIRPTFIGKSAKQVLYCRKPNILLFPADPSSGSPSPAQGGNQRSPTPEPAAREAQTYPEHRWAATAFH